MHILLSSIVSILFFSVCVKVQQIYCDNSASAAGIQYTTLGINYNIHIYSLSLCPGHNKATGLNMLDPPTFTYVEHALTEIKLV